MHTIFTRTLSFFSLISATDSFSSEPLLLLPLYDFVGAAARAGSYDFEKILFRAGPGMGKRYFGAGAGRQPINARPGFQVWDPCVRCT